MGYLVALLVCFSADDCRVFAEVEPRTVYAELADCEREATARVSVTVSTGDRGLNVRWSCLELEPTGR